MLLMVQLVWCQCAVAAATATNADYTCVHQTQNIKPNINLVIDFSGSMRWPAYTTCDSSNVCESYDRYAPYYGYFKTTSYYKYNTTAGYWEENDNNCTSYSYPAIGTISSNCLSGNILNFFTTTRVNVVRKILTGGRFDSTTNTYVDEGEDSKWDPFTDPTTHCVITKSSSSSTARTMLFSSAGATGGVTFTAKSIVVSATAKTFTKTSIANGFVVGDVVTTSHFTNSGNNGTFTITAISSDKKTITFGGASGLVSETSTSTNTSSNQASLSKAGIAANACELLGTASSSTPYNIKTKTTTPSDVTGVVQALYPSQIDLELTHFSGSDVVYYHGKNGAVGDYVNAINTETRNSGTNTGPALAEVAKFFQQTSMADSANTTLMISKTTPTKDPYYDTGPVAVKCRKAFALLISDGAWGTGVDPVIPAYYMHMNDLRPEAALPDAQTVTTFTVYAFGDGDKGRNALINTAMWGGFTDKDGNNAPYPFAAATATQMASGTYDPFGGSDSLNYPTSPATFPIPECDPEGTWSTSCAEWADSVTGLPYNFFEGANGDDLKAGITSAVNSMLGVANSGTAASVIGNADSSGSVLLQALYYPEKEFTPGYKTTWLADLQAYWYYVDPLLDNISIREDSINDLKLNRIISNIATVKCRFRNGQ